MISFDRTYHILGSFFGNLNFLKSRSPQFVLNPRVKPIFPDSMIEEKDSIVLFGTTKDIDRFIEINQ